MRMIVLSIALAASLSGLGGCTSNPNSPALQAMDNPPNSCGPGGSQDQNVCQAGR